jgi:hypothetical protein
MGNKINMTKEELLRTIEDFAKEGLIKKEEIIDAYEGGFGKKGRPSAHHFKIANILYYIGGGIVFLGAAVFVWQNWSVLSGLTKILTTFGGGIASYFVGFLFSRDKKLEPVSRAFYFISALLTPLGLHVVFDYAGFDIGRYPTQSLISGILFGVYLFSYFAFKKDIFLVFNIIFGTWLFFSLTSLLVGGNPKLLKDFFEYRVFLTGLSYISLGLFFRDKKPALVGPLYGFGIFGILGAALALGGVLSSSKSFLGDNLSRTCPVCYFSKRLS